VRLRRRPVARRGEWLGLRRAARQSRRAAGLAGLAHVRWSLLGAVPGTVLTVRQRRRLGLPRALSTALAATVPLSVAAAMPRGSPRHVVLWSAQMWAYKVAFEIPYDRPQRLRTRLRVDGRCAPTRGSASACRPPDGCRSASGAVAT